MRPSLHRATRLFMIPIAVLALAGCLDDGSEPAATSSDRMVCPPDGSLMCFSSTRDVDHWSSWFGAYHTAVTCWDNNGQLVKVYEDAWAANGSTADAAVNGTLNFKLGTFLGCFQPVDLDAALDVVDSEFETKCTTSKESYSTCVQHRSDPPGSYCTDAYDPLNGCYCWAYTDALVSLLNGRTVPLALAPTAVAE